MVSAVQERGEQRVGFESRCDRCGQAAADEPLYVVPRFSRLGGLLCGPCHRELIGPPPDWAAVDRSPQPGARPAHLTEG
jgi:hypothetical protein